MNPPFMQIQHTSNPVPTNSVNAKEAFLHPSMVQFPKIPYTCMQFDRPLLESAGTTTFVFSVSHLTDEIFILEMNITQEKILKKYFLWITSWQCSIISQTYSNLFFMIFRFESSTGAKLPTWHCHNYQAQYSVHTTYNYIYFNFFLYLFS